MVHHICLLETQSEVTSQKIEEIMVETRIRLLKIPEVSHLSVGKQINPEKNTSTFFFSFDVENMDKLEAVQNSAVYAQYEKQIITPYVSAMSELNYEMEPGKDIRYS